MISQKILKHKPKSKPIDAATSQKAIQLIKQLDFEWWMKRRKVVDARRQIEKELGVSVSPRKFCELRKGNCQWFKETRRISPSLIFSLSWQEWDRLGHAVRRNADEIQARTIDEAVAILCARGCKCNSVTLNGLRSELHFWRKA